MRFEIAALLLGARGFQHTLRFGATVRRPAGGRAFIVALLCGALADFAEIDDLAHRAAHLPKNRDQATNNLWSP